MILCANLQHIPEPLKSGGDLAARHGGRERIGRETNLLIDVIEHVLALRIGAHHKYDWLLVGQCLNKIEQIDHFTCVGGACVVVLISKSMNIYIYYI
jgi:hypothetical protein